ncbi:hypothetical protein [Kitasatospora sp. NPDC097643]|uniref:hypothetical protein n=1 Tax=Kitasatospora sp. NPDC097643 TaxID=3157230 RepID=UPI00331B1D91
MVDHRELFEDVTAALARAGFDTGPGPSRLRIGHRPQGVVVGWAPGGAPDGSDGPGGPDGQGGSDGPDGPDGPPSRGARAAVSGAAAVVLRECGYRVTETDGGELLVTASASASAGAEPVTVPADGPVDRETVPEQWWG